MTIQTIRHQNILSAPLSRVPDVRSPADFAIPEPLGASAVQQFVYVTGEQLKSPLTVKLLAARPAINVLIYVRTNFAADTLAEYLNRSGITAESVHGNKSQRTKSRTVSNFMKGSTSVIVATESAASAMDAEVSTVVNYDLPLSAETYSKRIERYSQTGKLRQVISLCDICDQPRLINIKRALPDQIQIAEHENV